MPLKLTDEQVDIIFRAAGPLEPDARSVFLQTVADRLGAADNIGDGTVYRISREVQGELLRPPTMIHQPHHGGGGGRPTWKNGRRSA